LLNMQDGDDYGKILNQCELLFKFSSILPL
jgi:hypothetical protein